MEPIYKTKDQNRRFWRAANIISAKIAKMPGVVGVMAAGGIGRGHSDEFSDLDLIVFAKDNRVKGIADIVSVHPIRNREMEYEILVYSYDKAAKSKVPSDFWSQVFRWTLENAHVLNEKRQALDKVLKAKLIFPDAERLKLMKHYHHWAGEYINFMLPAWDARGGIHNQAYIIRKAAEYVILWTYAKNRKFQPYLPKWLFYGFEHNAFEEAKYLSRLKKVFIDAINSKKAVNQMRSTLYEVSEHIGMNIPRCKLQDAYAQNRKNWKNASQKTRFFLSW